MEMSESIQNSFTVIHDATNTFPTPTFDCDFLINLINGSQKFQIQMSWRCVIPKKYFLKLIAQQK